MFEKAIRINKTESWDVNSVLFFTYLTYFNPERILNLVSGGESWLTNIATHQHT